MNTIIEEIKHLKKEKNAIILPHCYQPVELDEVSDFARLIEDIERARQLFPKAKILTHPECHTSVCVISDFVGSTKEIMEYARDSREKQLVVATEKGVLDRLKRDYPQKEFYLIRDDIVCTNTKWNSLEDIYEVLKNETNEIDIDSEIFTKANLCITKMMDAMKEAV